MPRPLITDFYRTVKKRRTANVLENKDDNIQQSSEQINESNSQNERSSHELVQSNQPTEHSQSNQLKDDRIGDVKMMRTVFKQAEHIQQSQSCVQALHRFIVEFEFHEFYEEFCCNLKCSLQYEHANPNVKHILEMVATFVLSVKKKYSVENLKRANDFEEKTRLKKCKVDHRSSVSDENVSIENDENDVPTDEIIQFVNEATSRSKKSTKRTSKSTKSPSTKPSSTKSLSTKPSSTKSPAKCTSKSSKKLNNKTIGERSSEQQLQEIYGIFRNLLDFVINDVLIPFLDSINLNTRLNTSFLIGKLINSIDDLDTGLFDRLKAKLLEKLIDKSSKMRSSAAYLLFRFQDQTAQTDAVRDALSFHLKYDSSAMVRVSCLNVILINKETLPVILSKTRDLNEGVRKRAFVKLAKRINFKQLNNDDRLSLIRNGLNDRERTVVCEFKDQVIPAWTRSYMENLIELVKDLGLSECVRSESAANESVRPSDIRSNFKLIEQFLASHFETVYSTDQLSKFHLKMIEFCKQCLNDEFLIEKQHFNNETFFIWTSMTRFLKQKETDLDQEMPNNEIRSRLKRRFRAALENGCDLKNENHSRFNEIDENNNRSANDERLSGHRCPTNATYRSGVRPIDENNNQTVNIPPIVEQSKQQPKLNQTVNLPIDDPPETDHDYSVLDLVMPTFSKFINFFQTFCESSVEAADVDNEFMFRQLIAFLENYEIVDNSQRTMIFDLIERLLAHLDTISIPNHTEILMNYVQQNLFFEKGGEFFNYSIELVERLESALEQEELERINEKITPKHIRELELLNANESIKMHELKDKLDDALCRSQFDRAHEYQNQIDLIKQKCNKFIKEIQRMKMVLECQQARKQTDETYQFRIVDFPNELMKFHQILEIALKHVDRLSSTAESCIDRYVSLSFRTTRKVGYLILIGKCSLPIRFCLAFCPPTIKLDTVHCEL